jgi:hypothetical protein
MLMKDLETTQGTAVGIAETLLRFERPKTPRLNDDLPEI